MDNSEWMASRFLGVHATDIDASRLHDHLLAVQFLTLRVPSV
jgi:hypothetical protein